MRRRLFSFLLFFPLFGLLSASSCEFQAYSNSLEAGQSVQITGEATGAGFTDETNIEINCNANNANPVPATQTVTATKSAYTSSMIPFRAYCEYGQPNTDTTYTVSAKLLPTGVECTPTGSAAIQVKGTGQTANLPAQNVISSSNDITTPTPTSNGNIVGNIMEQLFGKPATPTTSCGNLGEKPCEKKYCNQNWAMCKGYVCNAPYVSNGDWPPEKAKCVTCAKGMKYDGGGCIIDNTRTTPNPTTKPTTTPTSKPTTKPPITPNPTVYATPQPSLTPTVSTTTEPVVSFNYNLKEGWNLIGAPGTFKDRGASCAFTWYAYDAKKKAYEKDPNSFYVEGKGLWVKVPSDCWFTFGSPGLKQTQTLNLFTGWNLISVQTNAVSPYYENTDCKITGGPWRYNVETRSYTKEQMLRPSFGYWVKVASDCTIKIGEDQPPNLLPEGQPSGGDIEPAGKKGRKYMRDAG